MRQRVHLTNSIVLLAAGCLFLPAMSLASHSWGNYHWARSTNPVNLNVGDNCNSTWDPYLIEAIGDWNSITNKVELTKVTGGTRPKTCKPTAGRIEVCNERYGLNGWLGLAQIWVTGNHITQAIAKVNDSYFNTSTYNKAAWRRFVMCQEVGHDFGLDHQDENSNNANLGSCMDYTNDPDGGLGGAASNDPSNEHPNGHDAEQLDTIYGGHLDSAAAVSSATTNGRGVNVDGVDLDNPGAWGQLVAATQGGGIEVYELNLGDGRKQITIVTWTPEAAAKRRGQ
jgi:hypothetical protein